MHSGQRRSTSTSSPLDSQRNGWRMLDPQLGQADNTCPTVDTPPDGTPRLATHPDRHRHLPVQRADDPVAPRDLQLAPEREVGRGRFGAELLHALGTGLQLDLVDVARLL